MNDMQNINHDKNYINNKNLYTMPIDDGVCIL